MSHTTRISLCIRVLSFLVVPGTLLLAIDPTPAFAQCGGMRGGNAGRDFGVGTGIGLGIGITRELIQGQRSNEVERGTKQGKAKKKDNKTAKKPENNTPTDKPKEPAKVGGTDKPTSPNATEPPKVGGPAVPTGSDQQASGTPASGQPASGPTPYTPHPLGPYSPGWPPPPTNSTPVNPNTPGISADPNTPGMSAPPASPRGPIPLANNPYNREHALTCERCQAVCSAKQSVPRCKLGETRKLKETIVTTRVVFLEGGNTRLMAQVRSDDEYCNSVECHDYNPANQTPCCTWTVWEPRSWVEWRVATGRDELTGELITKPEEASKTCTCGQLLSVITELKLLSPEERGNQGVLTARFDGLVAGICHTTITLPEAIKLAATCGVAAEFKNAITVDVSPAITEMIGNAGLGKKETGPGWSAPPPAQVAAPDPVPLPGGFGWTKPEKHGPATAGEPYPKTPKK